MESALIGCTGFVDGNLRVQRDFQFLYNSGNVRDMTGRHFTEVYCAGIPSVKWWANQHPEEDRAAITLLEEVLSTVIAERFVLISTVDVYPRTQGMDESFDCASLQNHVYGTHRLAFEEFCLKRFSRIFVVRLPGLFGDGIKKNVIFDLLNGNCLEAINLRSSFQYYYLGDINADIDRQIEGGVRIINYVTEPLRTSMIVERLFPSLPVGGKDSAEAHYDLRTRYAWFRGREGPYLYSGNEIMAKLEAFVTGYPRR